jgi:broad specificity phosphatase PhoE
LAKTQKKESVSTLFFIRHGQASFGQENYDQLSSRGYAQARLLAEHLLGGIPFDRLYTGTLVRQTETARALVDLYRTNGIPAPAVRQSEAFNEYDAEAVCKALIPELLEEDPGMEPRVANMFTDNRSFQAVFEAVMLRWVAGEYNTAGLPGWETFKSRMNKAIDGILANDGEGQRIAVFTSGGPIAVAVQRALQLSDPAAMRLTWQLINASITRFKCTSVKIMLATFNEHAHLERAGSGMVTYR